MSNLDLISVRPGEKSDEPFIYKTWLNGYLYGFSFDGCPHCKKQDCSHQFNINRGLDWQTFKENYTPVIKALLNRSTIKVACLKEDPNVILGYSISEGPRLHWAHVKEAWRGFKIFHQLIPEGFNSVSHKTVSFERILKKKFRNVNYNPFL